MDNLVNVNKEKLREIFQPARVVLGVVEDKSNNRTNIITLAFNMCAGYTPIVYALAIHNINYSYQLFKECDNFVMSIPGEKIFNEVMFCGTESGRKIDKFLATKLTPLPSERIKTTGIRECIANVECIKKGFVECGDHAIVIGEVVNARRDMNNNQRNIISIASNMKGYELLLQKGALRLAVVKYS
jgi:flavin reductase (DIM6/NTAB) family NADH-FMN oxidoreductase RutF